jgi:hypothetical protein
MEKLPILMTDFTELETARLLSQLLIVKIQPRWLYLSVLVCVVKNIFSRTSGLKASGEMNIYTPSLRRNGFTKNNYERIMKRE